MYRNTYVKIDETILKNNVKQIIKKYNQYEYYMGVVKGNCYGHGSYSVKALVEAGVNYLATSSLEEAIEVRKYEKNIPILCLEPIDPKYIEDIMKYHVTITVDSKTLAEAYSSLNIKGKVKVHLKLDTGMNRLGMKSRKEVRECISLLEENDAFFIEGIYTHMATTGVYDYYFDQQVNQFKALIEDIDLSKIKMIHIGRSLSLVNHPKLDFVNGIRLGIIMYGFNGSIPVRKGLKGFLQERKRDHFLKKYHVSETTRQNDLKLHTAFRLYSEVMSLKRIKKGEFVGYGAHFIAPKDMMIATLPIGYVDGMDGSLKYVSIFGKRYPIVGDVCMDMTMIAVDSSVKLHDKVEIFGDTIKIKEASKNRKTNAYHLFTSVTSRVPRVYQDGTEIKY